MGIRSNFDGKLLRTSSSDEALPFQRNLENGSHLRDVLDDSERALLASFSAASVHFHAAALDLNQEWAPLVPELARHPEETKLTR